MSCDYKIRILKNQFRQSMPNNVILQCSLCSLISILKFNNVAQMYIHEPSCCLPIAKITSMFNDAPVTAWKTDVGAMEGYYIKT